MKDYIQIDKVVELKDREDMKNIDENIYQGDMNGKGDIKVEVGIKEKENKVSEMMTEVQETFQSSSMRARFTVSSSMSWDQEGTQSVPTS